MPEIQVKKGESIDRALKRLKTKLEAEGIFDEMRRLRAHETPVERTRRKARNAAKKGKIKFRECDQQAVQDGYMVRVVKKDGFPHPIPEVIATYPGERTTPGCRKMTYDD